MKNRWSDTDASEFVERYRAIRGEEFALRAYTSRLIGAEPSLVLHGGGNTSIKGTVQNLFGEHVPALFIKASGHDLASMTPQDYVAVDLAYLKRLCGIDDLSDEEMVSELRTHLFDHRAPTPSIETPVHAFLPGRVVDHTHADAILALTNQPQGEQHVRAALGDDIIVLPYIRPGFQLAKQVASAIAAAPQAQAMVWMHHGIIVCGESPRESYERMIDLVSRAEAYLKKSATLTLPRVRETSMEVACQRLSTVAPLIRGRLARASGDPDCPYRRMVLRPLLTPDILAFLDTEGARNLALSPPLTSDHLIRTKILPAWVDEPAYDDETLLANQIDASLKRYAEDYQSYLERHANRMPVGVTPFEPYPSVVVFPGMGVLCAGEDAGPAVIAHDIMTQTLAAKGLIAAMGSRYQAPAEEHLFDMEYRPLQHAKLARENRPTLAGRIALVTGAAGAIGSGISARLLSEGAHVVVTDLPGDSLDRFAESLTQQFPDRVFPLGLDVADPGSVATGFEQVNRAWGGVDIVVINAGLAHVSPLETINLEKFRDLERVNTDGTLLLLREAATNMNLQGTGGDIVLVSTKNVFAPGAGFGAYSATKAAAHQLARVASQEFASHDIRVNMVAPDAVFSHGERASGLWAEVGPDRMRSRGLDPAGLEAYYRDRNLLKAQITAEHVGSAVLFFLTRATPTTGVTLPVDGGLPEATPR